MSNRIIGLAGTKGSGKDSTFAGFYAYSAIENNNRKFVIDNVADFCASQINVKYVGTENSVINVLRFYFSKVFDGLFGSGSELDYICIDFFNLIANSDFSEYLYTGQYHLYDYSYDLSSKVVRVAFADILKLLCMSLFGLRFEHCFGSQKQKNKRIRNDNKEKITVRELLQFIGTNVVRKNIDENAWCSYVMYVVIDEIIQNYSNKIIFITDCRFENEFDAIRNYDGEIVFLNGFSSNNDTHVSENECLNYENYDLFVDNSNMSIVSQCKYIDKYLCLGMDDEDVWSRVSIESK